MESTLKLTGCGWPDDSLTPHLDATNDFPADARRKMPDQDFNFRKFGHRISILSQPRGTQHMEHFLIRGLVEYLVVAAHGIEVFVHVQGDHFVC